MLTEFTFNAICVGAFVFAAACLMVLWLLWKEGEQEHDEHEDGGP